MIYLPEQTEARVSKFILYINSSEFSATIFLFYLFYFSGESETRKTIQKKGESNSKEERE